MLPSFHRNVNSFFVILYSRFRIHVYNLYRSKMSPFTSSVFSVRNCCFYIKSLNFLTLTCHFSLRFPFSLKIAAGCLTFSSCCQTSGGNCCSAVFCCFCCYSTIITYGSNVFSFSSSIAFSGSVSLLSHRLYWNSPNPDKSILKFVSHLLFIIQEYAGR